MQVKLRPSRYFMSTLLFIHITILFVLMGFSFQWWAKSLFALIVLTSLVVSIRRYNGFYSKKLICHFSKEGEYWYLHQHDGKVLRGTLLGHSVLTKYLLILNFSVKPPIGEKQKRTIIIFSDAVDANTFRRLRRYCYYS